MMRASVMYSPSRAVRLAGSLAIGALFFASVVAADPATSRSSEATAVSDLLIDTLPECSQSCFASAVSNSSCSSSDLTCLCTAQDTIIGYAEACTNPTCTVNEDLLMESAFKKACGVEAHDEANHLRSIFWSLYAVALVCFGSRLVARSRRFGGKFWWDDWFIVASFAVLSAVTIGAEIMCFFGLGKDLWDLDDFHIMAVLILFYIAEFAYVVESALTKTSIVVLYLRIFPSKRFRNLCYGMLAFIVCFAIVFLVTLLTYCVPFDYVWTMWDHRHAGKCINMSAQTYVCAALNIVMDVTIFLIPIPKLMKLETDWKTKIGVIFTFLLGLFVTICSIVRLKFLAGWASSTNQTYDYANLALWSLIELNAGVICACLPGMASLFRRIKKDREEKRRGTGYSYGNNSSASPGGSRMLNSKAGSALRSFGGGGNNKNEIMKTTSVSVNYQARDSDGLSDEVELVDQRMPSSPWGERRA